MKFKPYILLVVVQLVVGGCETDAKRSDPEGEFVKAYVKVLWGTYWADLPACAPMLDPSLLKVERRRYEALRQLAARRDFIQNIEKAQQKWMAAKARVDKATELMDIACPQASLVLDYLHYALDDSFLHLAGFPRQSTRTPDVAALYLEILAAERCLLRVFGPFLTDAEYNREKVKLSPSIYTSLDDEKRRLEAIKRLARARGGGEQMKAAEATFSSSARKMQCSPIEEPKWQPANWQDYHNSIDALLMRIAEAWGSADMTFITILSIFVLACFVGYFVVWGMVLFSKSRIVVNEELSE